MTAAPILVPAVKVKITVFHGKTPGESFVFDKSSITVGRGPENDIVFGNDSRMSRNHMEIRLSDGKLVVRNVSQKNYILVNKEKIDEKVLDGPAIVQVGETVLQILMEEPASTTPTPSSSSAAFSNSEATLVLTPSPAAPPAPVAVHRSPPAAPKSRHQVPPAAPTKPAFQSNTYASSASARMKSPSSPSNSRFRFYLIIAAVGGVLAWVVLSDSGHKKNEINIRTEGDVARAIEESARAVQEIQKQQTAAGQDSVQYKAAQEHYIRGFRDYRQGQFARSMQSFQAALSFYPNHELSRKYYVQAQRKFEAQIDFAMSQGRKYYQKNNYKMCQSSFASVMIMVKDSSKPKYKEAKQFYDECSLRSEGRF